MAPFKPLPKLFFPLTGDQNSIHRNNDQNIFVSLKLSSRRGITLSGSFARAEDLSMSQPTQQYCITIECVNLAEMIALNRPPCKIVRRIATQKI